MPWRGGFLEGRNSLSDWRGLWREHLGRRSGRALRESFEGEAVSRHDEIEAERLLREGIRALGLAGIKGA